VACSVGNLYVVNRILELLESRDFLYKTYGVISCIDTLMEHLLDSFLNTPDKNANNTPLHFACKGGHLDIVKKLLSYELCRKRPINR
jgi:ankyrin repeat protein